MMIGREIRKTAALLIVGLAALVCGCQAGFVQDAARTSLASFMTDVFSTAVTTAIGGDQ